MKPRSAIPLVGKKATAVIWFDDRGGWSTSSAFSPAPVPFLKKFIDANPIAADYDKNWTRSLDASAYQYEDDAAGEGTPTGWTRTFPHPLERQAENRTRRITSAGSDRPSPMSTSDGWRLTPRTR